MTPQEFVALVERVSYKPGWCINPVMLHEEGGVTVHLSFKAPDVTRPADTILVCSMARYTREQIEWFDTDEALTALRLEIDGLEKHEANEWFALDGVQVAQPHDDQPRLAIPQLPQQPRRAAA